MPGLLDFHAATRLASARPGRYPLWLAAGIGALLAATAPLLAQDDLYDGAKARVNRAAALRSLSEAVASASCRLNAGIGTDTAKADLAFLAHDFDTILSGLRDGSAALGIPSAEERSDNLRGIEAVSSAWSPIRASIDKQLAGTATDADVAVIGATYRDLQEKAVLLTTKISGHYSNPLELLQVDAIALDYIARQRMLISRVVTASCELSKGTTDAAVIADLKEAVQLFDASLLALRDGFTAAGISPPRNDAVRSSLAKTYELWSENKALFDDAISGKPVTSEMVESAADVAATLSVAINNITTLYMLSSPGSEGVYRVPLQAYVESELSTWITNPDLVAAINAQNARHSALTQDDIDTLDKEWRAEAANGGGELITRLLGGDVSEWLRVRQEATAGFVTEVFVMDNRGLNVAQSVETSDYWQGDEAKWQETYGDGSGSGSVHISEVEFDDSTGFYQTQASLPISDPATGKLIGAITFGINIQSLM